jgi:hypothetical protein
MNIIVCHPKYLSKLEKFNGKAILIDTRIEDYESLSRKFDRDKQIQIVKEFQNNIIKFRDSFSHWVDENLAPHDHISRLLAPISKNPFLDFYRELMWVITISTIIKNSNEDILIVTQSSGVMKTLTQLAHECGYKISYCGRFDFACTNFCKKIKSLSVLSYDLFAYIARIYISKFILGNSYISRLRNINVLIESFILQNDFLPSGYFINRYFPGLDDWYLSKNYNIAFYPHFARVPYIKILHQYKAIKKNKNLFLLSELFLSLIDLLMCLSQCIKHSKTKFKLIKPRFLGIDFTSLSQAHCFDIAISSFSSLIALIAPIKFMKKDLKPKLLLDWFENQPIDQATYIGFKEAFPACKVIACRPYALYSRNLLSYQVTNFEVIKEIVPNEHWVGGSLWIAPSSHLDNISNYSVMPNLRNDYLYNSKPNKKDGSELLIFLPYSLNDSLFILHCIGKSIEHLLLLFSAIRIKIHPALNLIQLKNKINKNSILNLNNNIFWESDSKINNLLNKARIVISSGSSTALESVIKGLPVIFMFSHQEIDMCPYEFLDKRMYGVVFDDIELMNKILEWSPNHPLNRDARLKVGNDLLIQSFERPNKINMNKFILSNF